MVKDEAKDSYIRNLRMLLQDIRKLLILYASKTGATSDEIGAVLGIGGSRIRNILTGQKTSRRKKRSRRKGD